MNPASQFTSAVFVGVLEAAGVQISMDGKARCLGNVFVERLWRSFKNEEVYLKAYDGVAEAKAGIGGWVRFYNQERFHQGLDERTPRQVYDGASGPGKCSPSPTFPPTQPQQKRNSKMI